MTARAREDSQLLHPRVHALGDRGQETRRQLLQLGLEFVFMGTPGEFQRLERVEERAHAMIRAMRRRDGLSRGSRGGDGRSLRGFPRRGARLDGCFHRHAGPHFTLCPGSADLNGAARSIVAAHFRKEVKHTLRAIGSPAREKGVAGGIQRTAAVSSNEASIAHVMHSAAIAGHGKPAKEAAPFPRAGKRAENARFRYAG